MICLRCDCTEFKLSEGDILQEFRNEEITVRTPVMECTMCGWYGLEIGQVDNMRCLVADEYRRKHGLLTSGAIRAMREALEMSQIQFAAFMDVGSASVKRWETWLVQEKSSDELLRLKFQEYLHRPNEKAET